MPSHVLLLGKKPMVLEDIKRQLQLPGIQLFAGTSIEDMRAAFASASIDTVIMGAGLALETRLEIVQEIFRTSDTTTVHLKDVATGPEGFLPFVRAVLGGLGAG